MVAGSPRRRRLVLGALLAGALALLAPAANARPGHAGELTADALETLLDPIIRHQIATLHIPGLALVVVQEGAVVWAKGYGYADLESRRPVDPDRTLFRIASVSKLFTATAVMQLVERGEIDLETDVNRYLRSLQIPPTFDAPVTITHLLTHAGGFDERIIGFAARPGSQPLPLGEYLQRRMPPRIMRPGRFMSYSNHGYALLGHVVETVSGTDFAQYVKRNIFEPLGMQRSSFLPPAPALASDLAVGYRLIDGVPHPSPFDVLQVGPAGQMIATATDVARFAIAMLQQGQLDAARIIHEQTALRMQRTQFAHHPRVGGFGYGFEVFTQYPLPAIGHGGSLDAGWGSQLLLFPTKRMGVFFCYNREYEPALRDAIVFPLLEQVGAEQRAAAGTDRVAPPALHQLAGWYRSTRFGHRSIEKLELLTRGLIEVVPSRDGTLVVGSDPYVQVQPGLFESRDGRSGAIAFRQDDDGRATHLFIEDGAYERVSWIHTRRAQLGWLAACMLLFLSACLAWPIATLRQHLGSSGEPTPLGSRLARGLGAVTCTLNLLFVVGLATALQRAGHELAYGLPAGVALLLVLPHLTAGAALVMAMLALQLWWRGDATLTSRIHYTLVTLAAVAFVPWLAYWNLLGMRY